MTGNQEISEPVWVTCRECEAHVSWCDNPETHTHVVWTEQAEARAEQIRKDMGR